MADLAKHIAVVEQNINSNIHSTSLYVQPAISTAGSSRVPLATVSEHQQVFGYAPRSAPNQRQAKKMKEMARPEISHQQKEENKVEHVHGHSGA